MNNLRQFINRLNIEKEIVTIDTEVDPRLEIAEIHRRVIAADGPALLFTRVKGKKFPVVTNLFGTARRVQLAFGPKPEQFFQKLARLPQELMPPTLSSLWRQRKFLFNLTRVGTKSVNNAPVQAHQIPGADLTQLPAVTSWIEDGGPFLTLPLVHTQGLHRSEENLGIYRVQIFSANEAGMHFQIGKGGGFHLHQAEQLDQALPVNVYLGGPPALILSAIAPLPENVPEVLLASIALERKLARSSSDRDALPMVAEAEFCIVGEVPPKVRRPEGPFGDHYGYYSLIHDYPVLRPRKIYHRTNAIFPATIVGKPRQEDFYLGNYLQELLSPMIALAMPGVTDLWSYAETGFHPLTAAVLKERYGRESRATMFRILGEGQLSLTKVLIGIDAKLDLKNFKSVLQYLLERIDWSTDLFIFSNLSMDSLDYAGKEINKGSKAVFLGVGPARRQLPKEWRGSLPTGMVRAARAFCPGCLVLEVPSFAENADVVAQIAQLQELAQWPLLIAVDSLPKALASTTSLLWTAFTRMEPAADIHAKGATLRNNAAAFAGPVLIDARMKPWYPKELFCDPDTAKIVDRRWQEYFPQGHVEMGTPP